MCEQRNCVRGAEELHSIERPCAGCGVCILPLPREAAHQRPTDFAIVLCWVSWIVTVRYLLSIDLLCGSVQRCSCRREPGESSEPRRKSDKTKTEERAPGSTRPRCCPSSSASRSSPRPRGRRRPSRTSRRGAAPARACARSSARSSRRTGSWWRSRRRLSLRPGARLRAKCGGTLKA